MTDISKSNEPVVQEVSPPTGQDVSEQKDNDPPARGGTHIKVPSAPEYENNPAENEQKPYRWREFILKYLPHVLSILALGVSVSSQNASWESVRNSKRSADAAEQSAVNSGMTADAAQKNVATARAALNTTIENSRLDQRAWVGLGDLELVGQVKAGTPMEFSLGMKNTGRTPALRVTLRGRRSPTLPETLGSLRSLVTSATPIGSYVIPPGETYIAFLYIAGEILTEQDVTNINEGRAPIYVFGTITYEDIFKTADSTPKDIFKIVDFTHETQFCFTYRYKKGRPQFLPFCKEKDYNQMK